VGGDVMTKILIGILLVIVSIPFGGMRFEEGMMITTVFILPPNFLGYLLVFLGLSEMENISRRFKKMLPFVVALGLYDVVGYANFIFGTPTFVYNPFYESLDLADMHSQFDGIDLTAIHSQFDGIDLTAIHNPFYGLEIGFHTSDISAILTHPLPAILGVVLMVIQMFILHSIVMGIREIDIADGDYLNSKKLYTVWKWILVLTAVVFLLSPLIMVLFGTALVFALSPVIFVSGIILFILWINFLIKFNRTRKLFYKHSYDRYYNYPKRCELEKAQSTCVGCSLGCNLNFYTEQGELKWVEPMLDYPVNKYFRCGYGLDLNRYKAGLEQNLLPMIRQDDGSFEPTDWGIVISQTAQKLLQVKEVYGADSIVVESIERMTLEETALLNNVRNFIGASCDMSVDASSNAYTQSFGYNAPPYTFGDIEQSEIIVLIGFNPAVTHPNIWKRIEQRQLSAKNVLAIDTMVYTETSKHATYHYKLKEDSYLSLLYILAKTLIDNDWVDAEYIEQYTESFEEFKEFLAEYTLDRAEAETGLSQEYMLNLATLLRHSKGRPVSFWWSDEAVSGQDGVRVAQAIINLALMTGSMGRPGTGANYVPDNGKDLCGMNRVIESINAGKTKALWLIDNNRQSTWLSDEAFKQAVEKLDLFIVSASYEITDGCDVLLPIVPQIQNEGTYVNAERRLSALNPVIVRGENELSGYEVILRMGQALGMDSLEGWQTPSEAFNTFKATTEGKPNDITGVDYNGGLMNSRGVQWPFGKDDILLSDERRLFEDGVYYTPSGKAKFMFE